MSDGIIRVVVVVPARDEEGHITDCLRALKRACAELRGEVQASVVVVANRCSDRTVERALMAGAQVLVSDASNVGAARHEGALWAIDTSPTDLPSGGLWIAFTDADSLVAPTWLRSQVEAAARGADAFLGTIMLGLDGRRAHPRWAAEYLRAAALG
ncbi:MAG: glycosyltransferase, partial [Mycobacteriaceae bacterium]